MFGSEGMETFDFDHAMCVYLGGDTNSAVQSAEAMSGYK
jgi:hypothetical protein